MNVFKKPIVFLALALLAIPMAGFSQYKYETGPFWDYFKDLQRYDISFSYQMPVGEFSGVTQVRDGGGNYYGDTTIKHALNAQQAFGASIGIAVPFKGLGHISCLAFAMQLAVSQYEWTDLNETYTLSNSFIKPGTPVNGTTQQFSLPLGIDYRIGCDVIKTRRLPFGAAFGLGVIPQYNMTSLNGVNNVNTGNSMSATPYVKAEFSALFGFCFRLRAMYTLGNVPLIDVNHKLPNGLTDGPFSVSSKSNLVLSFVIVPFSFGWRETRWFNTFDTYNKYDKIN